MKNKHLDLTKPKYPAFTIVELIIAITIIAIIAAITVVAYSGVQSSARDANVKTEANSASKFLSEARTRERSYPTTFSGPPESKGTIFDYASSGSAYSLTVTSSKDSSISYCVTSINPRPVKGACGDIVAVTPPTTPPEEEEPTPPEDEDPIATPPDPAPGKAASGDDIQTVTNENCPTSRIWVVDKRDSRTYWVQKMADDKCWMLTNLAYAGGGNNTYGDSKPMTKGPSGWEFAAPHYYIPPNANPTTNPTPPSTSTNGGSTNPQYGYMYNLCAAMGAQLGTAACLDADSSSPPSNQSMSICPSGWRLPTGGVGAEQEQLINALGVTNNSAGTIKLQQDWLLQRGGSWGGGTFKTPGNAYYWSSTPAGSGAHVMYVYQNYNVWPTFSLRGLAGESVRCVVN